jgi:hypothetical protein
MLDPIQGQAHRTSAREVLPTLSACSKEKTGKPQMHWIKVAKDRGLTKHMQTLNA